jgi:hypothetical protein
MFLGKVNNFFKSFGVRRLKKKINLRFFLTQVVLLCIVCNNLYKKRLCNDNDDNILDCVSELVVTTGFVNYAKNH